MYCTHCGSERDPGASICPNCGHPAPAFAPVTPVPNYLVQSVLVTLCCCLPLGIVALVFAAQVNSKLAAGDVPGAVDASRKARLFCWIGFGGAALVVLAAILINGAAFLAAFQEAAANR